MFYIDDHIRMGNIQSNQPSMFVDPRLSKQLHRWSELQVDDTNNGSSTNHTKLGDIDNTEPNTNRYRVLW